MVIHYVLKITVGSLWDKLHNMRLTSLGILQECCDGQGDFSKTIKMQGGMRGVIGLVSPKLN